MPLNSDPGEACQFDWSHAIVILDGAPVTVKVAHVRLSRSRMPFVWAYPKETQEMVFDAPSSRKICFAVAYRAKDKAFAFFGMACARGIYYSEAWPPWVRGQAERRLRGMRSSSTTTEPITGGSSRCAVITSSTRLTLGLSQWRLNERPCTTASGWEKGQVENQVGLIRRRFFVPRPKFKSYAELNDEPLERHWSK